MPVAFISGIILGFFFFGGLHFTVKYLTKTKYPAIVMILSLFIRLFILMYGFYIILQDGIYNLTVALLAMILSRQLTIYFIKKQ